MKSAVRQLVHEEKSMLQEPVAAPGPNDTEMLESVEDRRRLVALVNALAKEIERLDNDNAQLRAAINFYREAVRSCKRAMRRVPRARRTIAEVN